MGGSKWTIKWGVENMDKTSDKAMVSAKYYPHISALIQAIHISRI